MSRGVNDGARVALCSNDAMTALAELRSIVGTDHVLVEPDVVAGFSVDHTGRFSGTPRCVVRPADVDEVAAVLGICREAGLAVVPQGGNTGLVGAGVPRGGEVVVSTRRLAAVGAVDDSSGQLDVDAGATLARVQAAAAAAGWTFPLDFGARDSATVGGMVATNAGGVHALRYGTMRRRVVGLEWVGIDGSIRRRMLGLAKDNTGYDLSGLLCGSEGTLGVVTAARLQLVRPPRFVVTAWVEADSMASALAAAGACRSLATLEALELVGAECIDGARGPALLIQVAADADPSADLAGVLEGCTGLGEAAVATDRARRAELWARRDAIPESILHVGVPIKVDIAVALDRLGRFLSDVGPVVAALVPEAKVWRFGHAADGNIHVNVTGCDPHGPMADAIEEAVLGLAVECGGTISAEHGVGVAKARWLGFSRTPAEVATFAAIKAALDPHGLLNPGVLGLGGGQADGH